MPYRLLVMINQGGERICTGLAEKGQAYPFKFPLSLYQKFEIQRRSSREPEIIIYLFYWYFLRSLQSGCLSSGGNDILGWASGLPKLHTEVSAKDDLMSTQVV